LEQDYGGTVSSAGVGVQITESDLEDMHVGPRIGLGLTYQPTRRVQMKLGGWGQPSVHLSDGVITQSTQTTLAPPLDNVWQKVEDSETGLSFAFGLRGGVGVEIAPGTSLQLDGEYSRYLDMLTVEVPPVVPGQPVRFADRGSDQIGIGLKLRKEF
jgi:hypothetical protein